MSAAQRPSWLFDVAHGPAPQPAAPHGTLGMLLAGLAADPAPERSLERIELALSRVESVLRQAAARRAGAGR